jgi:hypothetical protein
MQTITKKLTFIIDVMPLAAPDHDPIFMVTSGWVSSSRPEGYHRFRVKVEVPVPVADEHTDLPDAVAEPEEESDGPECSPE